MCRAIFINISKRQRRRAPEDRLPRVARSPQTTASRSSRDIYNNKLAPQPIYTQRKLDAIPYYDARISMWWWWWCCALSFAVRDALSLYLQYILLAICYIWCPGCFNGVADNSKSLCGRSSSRHKSTHRTLAWLRALCVLISYWLHGRARSQGVCIYQKMHPLPRRLAKCKRIYISDLFLRLYGQWNQKWLRSGRTQTISFCWMCGFFVCSPDIGLYEEYTIYN